MRATWLLLPAVAALALTVPTGCCRVSHRAQMRAKRIEVRVGHNVQIALQKPPPEPVPAPPAPPPPPRAEEKVVASWDVKGWGRNQAEAEQDALEKARQLVAAHLRRQDPPLLWTPPAAYVRQHLVTGPAVRHKEEDQPVAALEAQCWSLPVQVSATQYRAMAQQARADRARQQKAERDVRAEERLLLAGRVLAGLMALLVGAIGYIRLDDWTGGYYTRWLRFGLGGVLAAACLGLWIVG